MNTNEKEWTGTCQQNFVCAEHNGVIERAGRVCGAGFGDEKARLGWWEEEISAMLSSRDWRGPYASGGVA